MHGRHEVTKPFSTNNFLVQKIKKKHQKQFARINRGKNKTKTNKEKKTQEVSKC